jgi:mRNA deadenylase 3'-5' endonuclease subunit Ccr4
MAAQPTFSVATYNVLASCYVQRARYPRASALILDPAWRVPALAQHITTFNADIVCLQEVEPETLGALRSRLASSGARYARKGGGSPEGCATFYRQTLLQLVDEVVIQFTDGDAAQPATGNIALVDIFQAGARRLGIVNTHLTWDEPGTPRDRQRSLRQTKQLLCEYERLSAAADAWIIAGDLNASPDSEILALIAAMGFAPAHRQQPPASTCCFAGKAAQIDYLLHSSELLSTPCDTYPIDHQTVLPSAEQPSDHVAVRARFEFAP